jgi:CBS domain-containing protein
MARNPKWCRPLSAWKSYFSGWIRTRNPQDLLSIQIFFDFRCVHGDPTLTEELRRHLRAELRDNPGFFPLFAQNAQLYKPPLGLFGQVVGEATEGRGPKLLSLKDAMMPVVNFARLYALRHDVAETNTFDRLRALHGKNALSRSSHDEVAEAYAFLMEARLKRQAAAVGAGEPPGNQIDPKALSPLDEARLKKTLGQVGILLKKIGFDFLGAA